MTKKISDQSDHRDAEGASFDELLRQNIGMVKFTAVFFGLLWLFSYAYGAFFLDSTWFERYVNLGASLVSHVLSASGETIELARLDDGTLGELRTHDNANVYFDANTDGLTIMFTLLAAMLAWPGGLSKKLISILLGLTTIFALNILRVAVMLKVNVYWPLQMNLLNDWILPAVLVCFAALVFLIWIKISGRHPLQSH